MRKGFYRQFQFSERCGCAFLDVCASPHEEPDDINFMCKVAAPPPGQGSVIALKHGSTRRGQRPEGSIKAEAALLSGFFRSVWVWKKHVGGRTRLTGVLPSDRVVMLIDMLILSQDEEEREGGEGLLFSTSCLWRKSRHARWMLPRESLKEGRKYNDWVRLD